MQGNCWALPASGRSSQRGAAVSNASRGSTPLTPRTRSRRIIEDLERIKLSLPIERSEADKEKRRELFDAMDVAKRDALTYDDLLVRFLSCRYSVFRALSFSLFVRFLGI